MNNPTDNYDKKKQVELKKEIFLKKEILLYKKKEKFKPTLKPILENTTTFFEEKKK